MPFVPHTQADVQAMLQVIGVSHIEDLFDEIPATLMVKSLDNVPETANEMEVVRLMKARAAQDSVTLNFAGAGAYEHHIPAAVWQIVGRGEFYTAYTPYQAEASQGTLQLIYEYQTMMARLTGMDVSNASMYDGATAVAEAVLMAERSQKKGGARRVLVPESVHPAYRRTLKAMVTMQNVEIVTLPCPTGRLELATLDAVSGDFTSLIIPQPNYFGVLEEVDLLTQWAQERSALAIAVVNPMSLALLKAPGCWGDKGADITCGDGQPLGVPMSSGGPYFGFLACKKEIVRNMPGRIVGCTSDLEGRVGYTLTLQAREQHIRRAKATSNICTNQGLLVTAATIYMAMTGPEGLRRVAATSVANLAALRTRLLKIPGVGLLHSGQANFHEAVFTLPKAAQLVIDKLAEQRILAGVALSRDFSSRDNALLICTTETKTLADIETFATALEAALI